MWNFEARENESIAETVKRLFDYCDDEYNATLDGCREIFRGWQPKADKFDALFKDMPGYVEGEHCIVIDNKRIRATNPSEIISFWRWVGGNADEVLVSNRVGGKTKQEWYEEFRTIERIYGKVVDVCYYYPEVLDYHKYIGLQNEYNKLYGLYYSMEKYTPESQANYDSIRELRVIMSNYDEQTINEEMANALNNKLPDLKVRVGQKTSKVVRKALVAYGMSATENFERKYAKFSDAINPLETNEKLVISWNLLDYLTMSFGTSWTSCHTIDKGNLHEYKGRAAGYGGCCSSGTLSYAFDMSSLVMYSVNEDVENKNLWSNGKIRRQMFHISQNGTTFVQGRLYPDDQTDCGNECASSEYKNWREIMQNLISKAYDFPNLWTVNKGCSSCEDVIDSYGTHYRDYEHYGNCNASIAQIEGAKEIIYVGNDPICPCCGNEHDGESWCTCDDCRDGVVYCAHCGRRIERNSEYTHRIDGDYYCDDCVSYCEYHEEYEPTEIREVIGFGYVCDDGIEEMIDNGDAYTCEECGDIVSERVVSCMTDRYGEVHHFCCDRCADYYHDGHYDLFEVEEAE